MKKAYLGIDIGSISTKGVIIDSNNQILASDYLYTEGNPIEAVKKLVSNLKNQFNKKEYKVVSIGTTGSARKLIGTILGASVIKNEITAHAIGTTSIIPEVNTIFEIGKILLQNSISSICACTLCLTDGGSLSLLVEFLRFKNLSFL